MRRAANYTNHQPGPRASERAERTMKESEKSVNLGKAQGEFVEARRALERAQELRDSTKAKEEFLHRSQNMGYYINPPDCSKEQWLEANGTGISMPGTALANWDYTARQLPVCLVDNGAFTAAGIAYCEREAEAFAYTDGRRKRWYAVDKAKLEQFCHGHKPWEDELAMPSEKIRGREAT